MSVNWIKASIIPKQWEGTRKLAYNTKDGVHFAVVTPDFSRIERHCFGWWYANVPEPPTE